MFSLSFINYESGLGNYSTSILPKKLFLCRATEHRKLKRELSAEISKELRSSFMNAAPKALSILMDVAENSASDSVKFQASKDLLDRAGFPPVVNLFHTPIVSDRQRL